MLTKEALRSAFPFLVKWDYYGADSAAASRTLKAELSNIGLEISNQEAFALFAFSRGRYVREGKMLADVLQKVEQLLQSEGANHNHDEDRKK